MPKINNSTAVEASKEERAWRVHEDKLWDGESWKELVAFYNDRMKKHGVNGGGKSLHVHALYHR